MIGLETRFSKKSQFSSLLFYKIGDNDDRARFLIQPSSSRQLKSVRGIENPLPLYLFKMIFST